jgi:hypothetical protein
MAQKLSDIRDRIHRKSANYFTFDISRRERTSWQMFYGATDALLDASMAAEAFSRGVRSDPAIDLLICYGFLQALYIQQDAVWTLSRSVKLAWHPNDDPRIKDIREIRNRLTGHPALAEKLHPTSSAIIAYHDIRPTGFHGHIYFERGSEKAEINVATILADNEERLSIQMQKIEQKMDDQEAHFRSEHAKEPFSKNFGTGFDYLIERLCPDLKDDSRVIQSRGHAIMIREKMNHLNSDISNRGFSSDATSYHFGLIFTGLDLIEQIFEKEDCSTHDQNSLDLICTGFEKGIRELRSITDEIDAKLNSPVGEA